MSKCTCGKMHVLKRTLCEACYVKELGTKLEAAKAVIKEADEYLDTNDLTSIGHGSILHQKFKSILGNSND